MLIRFTKLGTDRHHIVVERDKGPDVELGPQVTDSRIPHDLVHAVVESALGIRDGFWAAFAAGATFGGFEPVEATRHKSSGSKVLRREGDAIMRAELVVNWCYRAWTGKSLEGGGVGRPQATDEQVAVACRALDEATTQWDAVSVGDSLVWEWP